MPAVGLPMTMAQESKRQWFEKGIARKNGYGREGGGVNRHVTITKTHFKTSHNLHHTLHVAVGPRPQSGLVVCYDSLYTWWAARQVTWSWLPGLKNFVALFPILKAV